MAARPAPGPPPPVPEPWAAPPRGRVLWLAPHPDDETLGGGGTLALHRAQRDPVRVIFATDGGAGDPAGHYPPDRYVALRREEARRAAEALGGLDLEFWPYPDGTLAGVADLDDRLAAAVAGYRPDVLYYPSAREGHPDHRALGLGVEALHAAGRLPAPAYAYEVWTPLEPTHVLDVTATIGRKRAALEAYPSQLRYNDYRPKILGLNAYRTITLPAPAAYAEAFRRLG